MVGDTGTIVTVDGQIDPDELGITMCHEHLFIDVGIWMERDEVSLKSPVDRKRAKEPISLDTLWYAQRSGGHHIEENMKLDSLEQAIEEMALYHRIGGDAIVDVTPKPLGDPPAVRAVMRETGVNIVQGTSFYIKDAHPPRVEEMSIDEIRQEFVDDITAGIDSSNVRAGIIGEIGISGTIFEAEQKVLRGGARAALDTGASVTIHPNGKSHRRDGTYPSSRWGLEILDILEEEGLPPERVVIDHMDRALFEGTGLEYQKELAERGTFIEYDLWGSEEYYHTDMSGRGWARPSNMHRVEWITELVEEGYASNLLFSQDICKKIQTAKYGGYGYFHIINDIIPILLGDEPGREFGITPEDIDQILIENPKEMLTFSEPEV